MGTMPRFSLETLTQALTAHDTAASADALGVPIVDAGALWRATEAGTAPRDLWRLARAARRSAQPPLSLARMLELIPQIPVPAAHWDAHGRHALAAVLGGSDAASRYILARRSVALPVVRGQWVRQRKPLALMRDEVRARRARSVGDEDFEAALRRYRVREWVRVVARMLAGYGSTTSVLAELSDLADVVVEGLTAYLLRRERGDGAPFAQWNEHAGFAVFAQGKLGGHELNVSSDIDVQFLYGASDMPRERALVLHERFARVAQRLVQGLTKHDHQGFCYRVDLDLRPEGKKGALINSVAGAEHYYEVWGQSWERLALLRARHVAGASWVTESFLQAVRPFVFPRSLDMSTVDEIKALKERVFDERKSKSLRRGRAVGVDIKRDPGAIREVELFVQILQFLHGGRVPALRTPSLLLALERVQLMALLPLARVEMLRDAYLFFRDVENVIQAREERQTHRLPENADELAMLARLLGRKTADNLSRAIARRRGLVTKLTRPLFERTRTRQKPNRAFAVLSRKDAEQRQALTTLGFGDSREAQGLLEVLASSVGGPFSHHAQEKVRRLAPALLKDMAQSPDPDQALRLFVDLNTHLRRHPGYYRLLDASPALRRRLIDLLGASEFLGRTVLNFPELIDWLAAMRSLDDLMARPTAALRAEIEERRRQLDDVELQLRSLRRFKLQEQLRLGILDLAGTIHGEAITHQLTALAEACLGATLDVAREDLRPRLEGPCEHGFAILGMGRLGAGEMGYGSDLDLLFIYDDTTANGMSQRDAVRLAQRLIQMITFRLSEGVLYPIDTRLRPSGAQGPLVSSAQGFCNYHRDRAMLWERQALLRARPVAGDLQLGTRVLQALDGVRYPADLGADAAAEIHRVRQRMEKEIGREGGDVANIKSGKGGLVDLEFAVQFLQMRHAHAHPALKVTSTATALAALGELDILPERKSKQLLTAYRFMRLLESRLRIAQDKPATAINFADPTALQLARRMGYARGGTPVTRLRQDYGRATALLRRFYNSVVQQGANA